MAGRIDPEPDGGRKPMTPEEEAAWLRKFESEIKRMEREAANRDQSFPRPATTSSSPRRLLINVFDPARGWCPPGRGFACAAASAGNF